MAGPAEGFGDYTLLLNEESNDVIDVPAGATYGSDPSVAPYRQAGYSVALNTKTGAFHPMPVNGRHNHENTVVVPGGWDDTVALSGDDTFTAPEFAALHDHRGQPVRLRRRRRRPVGVPGDRQERISGRMPPTP